MLRLSHICTILVLCAPAAAGAQAHQHGWLLSAGPSGGLAGNSGASLSFTGTRKVGVGATGEVLYGLSSRLYTGLEVDYWTRTKVNSAYVDAVARGYFTPSFYVKAGVGIGSGDFGNGRTTRPSLQFGAGYDVPVGPRAAVSLFANSLNTIGGHSDPNVGEFNVGNIQLLNAGVALTFR